MWCLLKSIDNTRYKKNQTEHAVLAVCNVNALLLYKVCFMYLYVITILFTRLGEPFEEVRVHGRKGQVGYHVF